MIPLKWMKIRTCDIRIAATFRKVCLCLKSSIQRWSLSLKVYENCFEKYTYQSQYNTIHAGNINKLHPFFLWKKKVIQE